jgi:uncharacterized protein GlcG (DUF336 family)
MSEATRTFSQPSVSVGVAQELIDAAIEHATSVGISCVVAVVDAAGTLKAFQRMDGASLLAVQIAQDKAYTAAAFGLPTHAWHDFIKDDPPLLHGIVHTPRLVVFGGGYPITIDGSTVGGLGVSGGHYSDDMAIAEAALKRIT